MHQKNMNKWLILLLILSVVINVFLVYSINSDNRKSLTYESFKTKSEQIMMDVIKPKYVHFKVGLPVLRSYPGNLISNWADTEWTYYNNNGLNPTCILGTVDHGEYISSISIHYTPSVTEKTYLGVHFLKDHEEEFITDGIEMNTANLQVYNTSFGADGLAVSVITFLKEDQLNYDPATLIGDHSDIVVLIQQYFDKAE